MTRLRHDLNFVSSAGLIASGLATAVTGLVSDLWDLNDFWYHTVSGYAMGGFAILHVILNWSRLVGYARFRIKSLVHRAPAERRSPIPRRVAAGPAGGPTAGLAAGPAAEPEPQLSRLARSTVSRRGLLGLAVGGVGGLLVGRGLRPAPQIPQGSDVGVIYHQWSKPGIIDALGSVANWGQVPELYKAYPGAPVVALPPPNLDGGPTAARTIASRRSVRSYSSQPMTLAELSRVLWLTCGISAGVHGNARRTAPSSGALYPIEVYPVVHNVEGLERGVYHYAYREHALELVRADDLRAHVVEQGIGQEFLGQCGAVLFLTMILQRMRPKYQDRSYRYGLLEAGCIGENAYLAATEAGLGACAVGAFMDDQINAMLGVDGVEEAAVFMVAVGHRAG
ncbi:MAG TPA: SagB family peptide dehydrogenase [Candidatus Limnocylindrales bacterium]|nr:SagB family peptide dehydrogenase [Candidatus Limnocylindrales bacterium]